MRKYKGKGERESLDEDLMWFNRSTRISCSTEQLADCHLQQPITYLMKTIERRSKFPDPKTW